MIEDLIHLTSTEPYKSNGGMRVKEILIKPWESPNAKFLFEVWTDEWKDDPREMWEVTCIDLAHTQAIPLAIIPRTQLKLYDDHPLLWSREVYFSITSGTKNIPALMGDLFIEHTKVCGNWVDFHWLYGGLPKTLETLRENQLAIPDRLKDSCFHILERYGIQFSVNTIEGDENNYQALFFSSDEIWPDIENFKQGYIVGKEFSARRLS
ncbi:MAG TPA: hypothetical protein VIH61_04805 [Waddliaceae bacterium]